MKPEIELALTRGYLYSKGPDSQRSKLEREWLRLCLKEKRLFIVGYKGYISPPKELVGWLEADLQAGWWLSPKMREAVETEFSTELEVYVAGNRLILRYFPHGQMDSVAQRLLGLLHQHRPGPEEAFSLPAPLKRGLAHCTFVEGMEQCLTLGELYYIREIPNMKGHVLALCRGGIPVVGAHLERFEFLRE